MTRFPTDLTLAWLGLGGTLLGLALAIYFYQKQRRRKHLDYRMLTVRPFLPHADLPRPVELKVYYGDEPVQDPHLVALRVVNAGDVAIAASDFVHPLAISVASATILSASVTAEVHGVGLREDSSAITLVRVDGKRISTDACPTGSNSEASERSMQEQVPSRKQSLDRNSYAVVKPVLLQRGDWIEMQLVLDGSATENTIKLDARIRDIKAIRDQSTVIQRRRRLLRILHPFNILAAIGMFMVVVGPTVDAVQERGSVGLIIGPLVMLSIVGLVLGVSFVSGVLMAGVEFAGKWLKRLKRWYEEGGLR